MSLLFADMDSPIAMPQWLVILLALLAPTGPVFIAVQWAFKFYRAKQGYTAKAREADREWEASEDAVTIKEMKAIVRRYAGDIEACEQRADRQDSEIRELRQDQLVTKIALARAVLELEIYKKSTATGKDAAEAPK